MRSTVLTTLLCLTAMTAAAQMGGGPQNGSSGQWNMMSTDMVAPAAGRGPGGVARNQAILAASP